MIGSQLKLGFSLACALVAALALPALAKDKGVPLETEQDHSALQTAESACAVRDFTLLLEAMAASDAVVRRYSAPEISVLVDGVVKPIAREEYRDFPLGMLEYSWISRASMHHPRASPRVMIFGRALHPVRQRNGPVKD